MALNITVGAAIIVLIISGLAFQSMSNKTAHPKVHCYFVDMEAKKLDKDFIVNPGSTIIVGVKRLANFIVKYTVQSKWPYFVAPACRKEFFCLVFDSITTLEGDATLKFVQNDIESTIKIELNTTSTKRSCSPEEEKHATRCCRGKCDCIILRGKPETICHSGWYGKCCNNPLKPERVKKSAEKECLTGTPPCEVHCSMLYDDPVADEKTDKTHKQSVQTPTSESSFEVYWIDISIVSAALLICVVLYIIYQHWCNSGSTQSQPGPSLSQADDDNTKIVKETVL